jgi:2-polyprenyl-3-methyl-5-hydroxy-6-metoxy-1,4-benzoquinol methylase
MSHVLEHIPTPLMAVRDAVEVLKPEGKLVLTVPNPVNLVNFIYVGLRKYEADRGHCFDWDQGHWENFLEIIAKVRVPDMGIARRFFSAG